jgi:DNA-binding GntR family transcriptional regulator
VDEHEALLQLIESGASPDDIEKAARRHRSATLDAYLAQAAVNDLPTPQTTQQ